MNASSSIIGGDGGSYVQFEIDYHRTEHSLRWDRPRRDHGAVQQAIRHNVIRGA